jgi:hypothetical protein
MGNNEPGNDKIEKEDWINGKCFAMRWLTVAQENY